jgi:urease accessory protein
MMISKKSATRMAAAAISCLPPQLALAHDGLAHAAGFLSGVVHPLTGLDHLLAMTAAGLLAAQLGGRAMWRVPLAFVAMMVAGGSAGMLGLQLPWVEAGIAASLIFFGLAVAMPMNLPVAAAVGCSGLFAILHGHAHGVEIPMSASGMGYMLGFTVSTTALLATGLGLGLLAERHVIRAGLLTARFGGLAVAGSGVYLLLS